MNEKSEVITKSGIKGPGLIYLQLLEHCNLRCSMCYEWGKSGAYHKKSELKQLEIDTVKNLIHENKGYHPHYWLYGGEPLLYPHLEEVLMAIKEADCTVEMDTNGTLLKENALLLIDTSVKMVHISLDGPEEVNDSQRGSGVFKRVIEGINFLCKCKEERQSEFPKISIGTTITEKNYGSIVTLYNKHLNLKKIDHVSLELQAYLTKEKAFEYKEFIRNTFGVKNTSYIDGFVTDPNTFQKINLEVLIEQINTIEQLCKEHDIMFNCYPKKADYYNCENYLSARWEKMSGNKRICVFPWVYTEITARGEVSPCHAFYDVTLGNIYEQSLLDIWTSKGYGKFRKECGKGILPNCYACCLYYHNKY